SARPSVMNARRSSLSVLASWRLGVCSSVMTRESPPIAAGEHRPERRRIYDQQEDPVGDREGDEDPDDPELPVARGPKAAEPAAKPAPLGEAGVVEGTREERAAAVPKAGVGLVDL